MKRFMIIAVNGSERWIMDHFATRREAEQEMKIMNFQMDLSDDDEYESTILHIEEVEITDTEI